MAFDTKAAAKRIIAETAEDREGPLGVVDDMVIGDASVQLRLPLTDPSLLRLHLRLIHQTIGELLVHVNHARQDRLSLMTARSTVRALNKKINAYKNPSRK